MRSKTFKSNIIRYLELHLIFLPVFVFLNNSASAVDHPSPVQTVFTAKLLGAKTTLPISWTDEPVGARGEPWYTVVYDDRAWPTGRLWERNSVPQGKSRLWRIPIHVDVPPSKDSKVMLRFHVDDSIDAYIDGYLLGTYGNRRTGVSAGEVDIDVTDHLKAGDHLLAVRVSNGPGNSFFSVKFLDFSAGSAEQIRKDFWKNLTSKDDAVKRSTVLAIRRLAQENPDDRDFQLKLIYTYLHGPGELRDLKQAELALNAYKNRKFPLGTEEETAILKEIGKIESIVPRLRIQAEEPDKYPDAAVRLGDALWDAGDDAGAVAAYEKGFQNSLTRNGFSLNNQLELAQKLLESGRIEPVTSNLPKLEEKALREDQQSLYLWFGRLYSLTGDYDAANRCYLRYEQQGDTTATTLANYHRLKRAFVTGDFNYCQGLIETELARIELLASLREEYGVIKVQVLCAQGKKTEAEQACGSIAWRTTNPENQLYLQRYLLVAKALDSRTQMKAAANQLYHRIVVQEASSKRIRPNTELLVDLAESLEILGNPKLATKYAKTVLENTPDVSLPANQWLRGRAALVADDNNLALSSLTKARNLDPKNYWVEQALKKITANN